MIARRDSQHAMIHTLEPGARIAELSWTEVGPRLERGAPAVLPVGAAAKEHGRHLPMNADWLQAEWLGGELARRHDVVVWPTVGYGHYPAFSGYPGSTSLSKGTFESAIAELLNDLARAGASSALVLNTGISTIGPIERAIERTAQAGRTAQVDVYRGERYLAVLAELIEQRHGGHADEAETSVLLHICPRRVDLGQARPWDREMPPGRFEPSDTSDPRYSPDGVKGDPTLASAEKGAVLAEAMLADLGAAVARLRAPP